MQQNKGTPVAISVSQAHSKVLLTERDKLPTVTAWDYCYQKIVFNNV